jgi:hypothetical protein
VVPARGALRALGGCLAVGSVLSHVPPVVDPRGPGESRPHACDEPRRRHAERALERDGVRDRRAERAEVRDDARDPATVDERVGERVGDLVGAQVTDATLPAPEVPRLPHAPRRELRVSCQVRAGHALREPAAHRNSARAQVLEHGEGRPLRGSFHQPLRRPRGRAGEIVLHHVHQLVRQEPQPVAVAAVVEQHDRACEREPDRHPRQIQREAPGDPDVADEPLAQRRATAIGAEHHVGRRGHPENPGERGRDDADHVPIVGRRDRRVRRGRRAGREAQDRHAVRPHASIGRPEEDRDGQHQARAAVRPPSPQLRLPTATGTVTASSRYGIAT